MLALLEFGTIWFWILCCIVGVIIVAFTEAEEDNHGGLIAFAVFLGLLYFGNSEDFKTAFHYVAHNPFTIIGGFLAYLALGTVWSFIKWFMYLKTLKAKHTKENGKIDGYYKSYFKAKRNKGRIINWMIWWPLSGVWTIINDPVVKSFKYIFNSLEGKFQAISDRITGFDKDVD
jgi:hypothetical protein